MINFVVSVSSVVFAPFVPRGDKDIDKGLRRGLGKNLVSF